MEPQEAAFARNQNQTDGHSSVKITQSISINNGSIQQPPHLHKMITSDPCSICLDNYKVGNEVVWSTNPNCVHVYHKECMLTWLCKFGEGCCPICRESFCIEEDVHCEGREQEEQYASELDV